MGDSASTDSLQHAPPPNANANGNGNSNANGPSTAPSERSKLTDKKTVHDLFDILQQHTLANVAGLESAPAATEPGRPARDERPHSNADEYNGDAHLVPILEP